MLRLNFPLLLLVGVVGYCTTAGAASFPSIVDVRINPPQTIEPREIEVSTPEGSYFDLIEIEDIDNDGIRDHQFQIFPQSYIDKLSNGEESTIQQCPSLHIVASSLVGSSVAVADTIEVKGLELLFEASDDPFACFVNYFVMPQPIADINNDQISELAFFSDFGLLGDDGNRIGSVVAFGKLEAGAVIDIAAVLNEGEGGFTISNNLNLQNTQADINGDGVDDPAFYDYRAINDGTGGQIGFGIINGASLALIGNLSIDTLSDENVLVNIKSNSYVQLSESADFNNDSFDDLIVSVYRNVSGNTNYILYGSSDIQIVGQSSDLIAALSQVDACDNCSVNVAGDFNADGFADLFLSGFDQLGAGSDESLILYGRSDGLPSSVEPENSTQFDFTGDGGYSFNNLSAVGDMNGDGASDLFFVRSDQLGVVLLGQPVADPGDVVIEQLNGENGFLLVTPSNSAYYFASMVDANNDGLDDIVSEYGNSVLLLGRPKSVRPLGVQGLSVATGQTTTFLNWTAPNVGDNAGRVEIFVNDVLIDSVNENVEYYQFSLPAPDSTAVLRVQRVTSQLEISPAIEVPLSNPFQGLRQLRAKVYGNNAVELFWENSPSGYVVWRNGEAVAQVIGNSYYDSDVQAGIEYRYHVTQGSNASGLSLGRSLTLPSIGKYSVCIDYCGDDNFLDPQYSNYFYNECLQDGVVDYRSAALRSLYPASTDELLVVTDVTGIEFSTPFVDVVNNCEQSNGFQVVSGGYQVYSQTALELFWERANHPSGVIAYEISFFDNVITTVDATSYYVDNLGNEVLYEYKVTAIAGDGSRSIPSVYSVYLEENDPNYIDPSLVAPEPANVRVEVYSSTAAELFWDAAYDYSGYPVQYRLSRNGELLQTTDAKSYFDSTLQPGTNYSYEVVTVSQSGIDGIASTIQLITPSVGGTIAGSGALPTGARGEVYSNNALELFWDRPSDDAISHFIISRNDEELGESGGTSFYSSGLNPDTEYRYSIQAKSSDGNNIGEAARLLLKTNR